LIGAACVLVAVGAFLLLVSAPSRGRRS
jgi:hypothetical protein